MRRLSIVGVIALLGSSIQMPIQDSGVKVHVIDADDSFDPNKFMGGFPLTGRRESNDGLEYQTYVFENVQGHPDFHQLLTSARRQNVGIFSDIDAIEEIVPIEAERQNRKRSLDYSDYEALGPNLVYGTEAEIKPIFLTAFRRKRFRATNPYLG